MLLAVAGCASLPPGIPLLLDDPRPARLLEQLENRAASRTAMRGVVRMAVDSPAGSARTKQILIAQRPANLRVEVMGFFNQTLAVLVTDGRTYDLFQAQDRVRRRGPVYPELLWDVARVDLKPEQVVGLLLGTPQRPSFVHVSAAIARDDEVEIELVDDLGTVRQRLGFDADENLRRVEDRSRIGKTRVHIRYDHYRDTPQGSFAHSIDLDFPLWETQAELTFGEVELNPELPEGIFELGIPEGEFAEEPGGAG